MSSWYIILTVIATLPPGEDGTPRADIYTLQPNVTFDTREECEIDHRMFIEDWLMSQQQVPDAFKVEGGCQEQ